jgi:hypothetical protein
VVVRRLREVGLDRDWRKGQNGVVETRVSMRIQGWRGWEGQEEREEFVAAKGRC